MNKWSRVLLCALLLPTTQSFAQTGNLPSLNATEHLGLQVSSDAIRVAMKSALDLMYGGKENAQIDYRAGKITKNFKFENPKYGKLVAAINDLFSLSAERGLTVNVSHSAAKITGMANASDISYTITKKSDEKFIIHLNAGITQLNIALPTLAICTDIKYKECQGGNYIKFKDVGVGLDKFSGPIKINMALEFSLNPVYKMVKGQKVLTKSASLKALKVTSNLNTDKGPKINLSYFKGTSEGIEYPQVSANQIGPAGFGVSFTSKDLKTEIEIYKNDLGKQIITAANDFIAKDMVQFLNNVLEEREFSSDFWVNYTGKELPESIPGYKITKKPDPKNEYVAKIDTAYIYRIPTPKSQSDIMVAMSEMIHDFTYGVKLSDMTLPLVNDKQFFNVLVDTDLFLNGQHMKPSGYRGYGNCQPADRNHYDKGPLRQQFITFGKSQSYLNCERPLSKIGFLESKKAKSDHNMAFALSESYVNSILKIADEQGLIKKLAKLKVNKPGVYVGREGIRLHIYKNNEGATFAYLIVNMVVKLSEQPSWVNRNIGGFIEKWWGNTGGIVRFPLEIPVWFKLKKTKKGQKIVVEGLSPFGQDGHLTNSFGYESNINSTADTWVADIQETIEGQIKEALSDIIDENNININGRNFLKPKDVDLVPMLGNLPADFKVTAIVPEDTGHLVIYGKMNKLDLQSFVKGRE
ncbi:MAG: hypothetical protein ACOYL6_18965 [Bacteriovoracaceae bacterium]